MFMSPCPSRWTRRSNVSSVVPKRVVRGLTCEIFGRHGPHAGFSPPPPSWSRFFFSVFQTVSVCLFHTLFSELRVFFSHCRWLFFDLLFLFCYYYYFFLLAKRPEKSEWSGHQIHQSVYDYSESTPDLINVPVLVRLSRRSQVVLEDIIMIQVFSKHF